MVPLLGIPTIKRGFFILTFLYLLKKTLSKNKKIIFDILIDKNTGMNIIKISNLFKLKLVIRLLKKIVFNDNLSINKKL